MTNNKTWLADWTLEGTLKTTRIYNKATPTEVRVALDLYIKRRYPGKLFMIFLIEEEGPMERLRRGHKNPFEGTSLGDLFK